MHNAFLRRFQIPEFNRCSLLRLLLIVLVSVIIFTQVLVLLKYMFNLAIKWEVPGVKVNPAVLGSNSMRPTLGSGSWLLRRHSD